MWSSPEERPEDDLMRTLYSHRDWLTPLSSLKAVTRFRRFAYSEHDYMCVVPQDAEITDKIYVISSS